jgi:hypothetical protein
MVSFILVSRLPSHQIADGRVMQISSSPQSHGDGDHDQSHQQHDRADDPRVAVRDAGPPIADQEEHGQQPEGNVDPSPAIPFMNDFALCGSIS